MVRYRFNHYICGCSTELNNQKTYKSYIQTLLMVYEFRYRLRSGQETIEGKCDDFTVNEGSIAVFDHNLQNYGDVLLVPHDRIETFSADYMENKGVSDDSE